MSLAGHAINRLRQAGCIVVVVGLSVAMVGGCGPGAKQAPTGLVPVSGVVTLDNQPLEGAQVLYVPLTAQGSEALDAAAITDAQGKYELRTGEGEAAGAAPGEYRIVISKLVMPDGSTALPTKDKSPMQLTLEGAKEAVPPAYSDLAFSTLKATVPAGGGKVDFPLAK